MRPIRIIFTALAGLFVLVTTASAGALIIGNGQVNAIGSTASMDITLTEAPAGLSGYSINVTIDNPSVAVVSAVSYPSWASLTEAPALPSGDCRLKATDMGEQVQANATGILLATVTLQGLAGGSTAVNLSVNKMNDDLDNRMYPDVTAGTFVVNVPIVAPVAAFTANTTTGTTPLTVAFTDQSTNAPTSWTWDFDNNGVVDSTARKPVHTYATAGTFTVNLTAANSAGSDSEVKTGYIVVSEPLPDPPVANFAKNVSSGAAPLAVLFTDTSTGGTPTSWAWDFQDDGVNDSAEQDPVFIYTTPGTYTVKLTVANRGGSDTRVKTDCINVSAPPAPVAAFTADKTTGTAPVTVTFTDQSTNTPTSWSWTFGDGGTSTQQNPSHMYASAGTYTVNLTATNAGGSDSEEKTGYITVSSPPVAPLAAFSADPTSGTAPLTVKFTDHSTNSPASWSWTFGDGATSTLQNPSHRYASAGTYTVNLTATNAGGSDSEEKAGYITVAHVPIPPVAAFSGTPRSGYAPLTVKFTDQSANSPTAWAWTFGDGGTSTQQSPSHTYTATGTYPVNLTVTNADGADSVEKSGYITVSSPPVAPLAAFSGTPTSGTAPLTVAFTDHSTNSPNAWAWTFGDGGTSSLKNPSHTYSSAGSYTVKLTATNAGGSDAEEKAGYITVARTPTPPVAAFTATPRSGYAPLAVAFTDHSTNSPTSWAWTFGDGGTSTLQNPSHTYSSAGTYTVNLTATNTDGSDTAVKSGYITVTRTPAPPVAAFSATPRSGNAPLIVAFTDQSTNTPTSWSWTFGDGATSPLQNPSHRYGSAGTYTVKLTVVNADGSDSEEKTGYITVSNTVLPPVASFTGTPRTGVAPLPVQFTDRSKNSPTSWTWTFGDGTGSTARNASHTYTTPGNYTVKLRAANTGGIGYSIRTGYIVVKPRPFVPPVAAFNATPRSGIAPMIVKFSDQSTGSPTSWSWVFGDGGTSTQQNPSHRYASTGTYTVKLTVTNADGSDNEEKTGYITVTNTTTPPYASFMALPRSGAAPLPVQFTDRSKNSPTSWFWTFGDGAASTEKNPSHTYTSPGNYTVKLRATNAAGFGSTIKTRYIVVSPGTSTQSVAGTSAIPGPGSGSSLVPFTDQPTGIPTPLSWTVDEATPPSLGVVGG